MLLFSRIRLCTLAFVLFVWIYPAYAVELTEGDYEYIITDSNTAKIVNYTGQDHTVSIPKKLGGYSVTEIGIEAFAWGRMHTVIIPEGVTNIDYRAFFRCDSLVNVQFPSTLTYLGGETFLSERYDSITFTIVEGSYMDQLVTNEDIHSINTKAANGIFLKYNKDKIIKVCLTEQPPAEPPAELEPQWAIFPMECMRITQGINSKPSHITDPPEIVKKRRDNGYALDITGFPKPTDDVHAPFDAKIVKIDKNPTGSSVTNTVFIQSQNKVRFADGSLDYMVIRFAHDDDISDLWEGKELMQWEIFYQEGTAGTKDKHVHMIISKGLFDVNNRYHGLNFVDPVTALVIDPQKTKTIEDDEGYAWKFLPDAS